MRVQGLITISDCKVERGGFHCVKSFRGERFSQWARDNAEYGDREDIAGRNFVEVTHFAQHSTIFVKHTRFGNSRTFILLVWLLLSLHADDPMRSALARQTQRLTSSH